MDNGLAPKESWQVSVDAGPLRNRIWIKTLCLVGTGLVFPLGTGGAIPSGLIFAQGIFRRYLASRVIDTDIDLSLFHNDHSMLHSGDVVHERYQILERFADGAFSAVFRVTDLLTGEELVLKVEFFRDRPCPMLVHEFCVANMSPSPFLCHLRDYIEGDSFCAVAMERLHSTLVDCRRKRIQPPSVAMLVNVTLDCLRGLSHLHSLGVIHSDVKPSNFAFRLESDRYRVVTFDYGLSQTQDDPPDLAAYRAGMTRNPRYLSLQVHHSGAWGQRDDLMSLLYSISEFWRDEMPWDGRTTNRLVLEVKDGFDIRDMLPEQLHWLIDAIDGQVGDIIGRLEEMIREMERDIEQEMHYIVNPPDQGKKRKIVQYIFEEGENKFKNKHSA
jgi:serine/threonine protein kinase